MFDALAPYSSKWKPSMSKNGIARRPALEFSNANRNKALSFAAYRAIKHVFYNFPNITVQTDALFASLGYNAADTGENTKTPSGIGNKACNTILRFRDRDGFNQLGDELGTPVGKKNYSDYTNYYPVNDPQPSPSKTDCSKLRDINRWQPLTVKSKTGVITSQTCLTPQLCRARGFALSSPFQFLPPGPPLFGTNSEADFLSNFSVVIQHSGTLDDRKKAIAEYWADGPNTVLPPGHWQLFAIHVATSRHLDLLQTVLLLFLQGNAALDAGISAWALKRMYDSGRPASVIPCAFSGAAAAGGTSFTAWKGPYMGVGTIDIADWQPYQDPTFVTPPFGEYPSGHSSFSAASAEVFKRFFKSDAFGYSVTLPEGASLFEPKITAGSPGYIAGVTDVPNKGPGTIGYTPAANVTLTWATFTDAANEAGMSRVYGGIHTPAGDVDSRRLGRLVGENVWNKVQKLVK